MDAATAVQNFSLTINRNFKASKQAVYDAWTNKEALTAWFAPTSEIKTVVHEMELKIGGKYRISMIEPDGSTHVIHGEYVALNPYDQVVFTWEWEGDDLKPRRHHIAHSADREIEDSVDDLSLCVFDVPSTMPEFCKCSDIVLCHR